MASVRQTEANRRNGRRGGPGTPQGKNSSRSNSLKHGLTASALVVLPEEDQREYQQVLSGFRESLPPCGAVERALVTRLAQTHWRSLRARRVETSMLDTTANTQRITAVEQIEGCPEHLDPHSAIGTGFLLMPPDRWMTYLRYDTSISRDFFKTLEALTRLQRQRQMQAKPSGATEHSAAAAAAVSENGIRFVSQNGHSACVAEAVKQA